MATVELDVSDGQKILDALRLAEKFFVARDDMNGAVHSAAQTRYSPITTIVQAEAERLNSILGNDAYGHTP